MKIEQVQIKFIQKQFEVMQSKEDFAKLLGNAYSFIYKEKIELDLLDFVKRYMNPGYSKKRYQTFTIKKKSGSDRIIHSPVQEFKILLQVLNLILHCISEPHEAATGFVLNKSIVDNANKHTGKRFVFNIDLKDFFHSFDRNRVKMGFMNPPFNLKGEKEPLAFLLACLCTHPIEIHNTIQVVLPQGCPTSPTLTNILCKKLDRRLTGLANRFGATYTRYADDITFSSMHNFYKEPAFKAELTRIIEEDQKLIINPNKTRLQKATVKQEVTGITVNKKANVNSQFVKQIRMWIYYWEKYGYSKAELIFKRDYFVDKGLVKNMNASLVNVLSGKLEFLKMVKGEKDNTYKTLLNRFLKLTKARVITDNEPDKTFDAILDIWEEKGIEAIPKHFRFIKRADRAINKSVLLMQVIDLGSKKKLMPEQNKRLLLLVSKEMKSGVAFDIANFQNITQLPAIDDSKLQAIDDSKGIYNNEENKVGNPKDVAEFMSLFNKRDGLKYLTHDYDEDDNFDIESFMEKVYAVFNNETNVNLKIPKSLYQMVHNFIYAKKWTAITNSFENTEYNSTGWTNWLQFKKFKDKHPINHPSPKRFIDDFRRSTRIENTTFPALIDYCIQNKFNENLNKITIEKIDLDKANFYTYVVFFKDAIETIFEEINKRLVSEEKQKLIIRYERKTESDFFVRRIIITHLNSSPGIDLEHALKEWNEGEKGNMGRIYKKLEGYCFWSVETIFDKKPYRINLLKEEHTPEIEEIISAEGFSHILTYYYK